MVQSVRYTHCEYPLTSSDEFTTAANGCRPADQANQLALSVCL